MATVSTPSTPAINAFDPQDPLLELREAAAIVPGRPSYSTVWRWATKGTAGVVLETLCVGGQRFTNKAALQRFFERRTAAAAERGADQ